MAVLSSNTDWSKIERIQPDLEELFSGFGLKRYSKLTDREIRNRVLPWFKERKAGSVSLRGSLVRLTKSAHLLSEHSRTHGTAEAYFTSLMQQLDGDPKRVALALGSENSEYKLPAFGVPLAAEALKNLGFDVAKPDRHVTRAVASFGLASFQSWSDRSGRKAPRLSSKSSYLAVMEAMQNIATAADQPVVMVDNAIWLLCAESGLYLTNQQLAELIKD